MTAIITLLLIWFVVSIPTALFVSAVFGLSNQSMQESVSVQTQLVD